MGTQVLKIPQDRWMDFTIEAINLIKKYQSPRQVPEQRQSSESQDLLQQALVQFQMPLVTQQPQVGPQVGYTMGPPSTPSTFTMRPTPLNPSPNQQQQQAIAGLGLQMPQSHTQQPQPQQTAFSGLPFYNIASPGYPSINTPQMTRVSPTQSSVARASAGETSTTQTSTSGSKDTTENTPTTDVMNLSMFNE